MKNPLTDCYFYLTIFALAVAILFWFNPNFCGVSKEIGYCISGGCLFVVIVTIHNTFAEYAYRLDTWNKFFALVPPLFCFFAWVFYRVTFNTSSSGPTPRDLSEFFRDHSGLVTSGVVLLSFLGTWFQSLASRYPLSDDKKLQTECVRLLTGFDQRTDFFRGADRSIYGACKGLISRLTAKAVGQKGKPKKYKLKLLLCLPTMGPVGNDEEEWGREFHDQLMPLKGEVNVHVEICHLHEGSEIGLNHLDAFVEVLAASAKGKSFSSEYNEISKMLKTYRQAWKNTSPRDDGEETFTERPGLESIPFQVLCATGDDFHECVLFFAGKEILEREKPPRHVGFMSSHPDVVCAVRDVFDYYVADDDRLPLVPIHTLKVRERTDSKGDHSLDRYFGLSHALHVPKGAFSPVYANSSKFASWVIQRELAQYAKPDFKVLEIGSGTGVQCLVAAQVLSKLHIQSVKIIASEADGGVLGALKENIDKSAFSDLIDIKQLELTGQINAKTGEVDSSQLIDGNNAVFHGSFDFVIADLPFVDANEGDSRFFDRSHLLHSKLFHYLHHEGLDKNGRCLTAFSSLGGAGDVARFERLIVRHGLRFSHKTVFVEQGYQWIIYVLMKADDFDPSEYWWKECGLKL